MKFTTFKSNQNQGSALVLTVIIVALTGLMLASYLQMVKSQNYNTVRSQAWNSAVPVIEAGLEDALTHMNIHTNALDVDGWQRSGSVYWIERLVADGKYFVTISNWNPNTTNNVPIVESRGFVTMPYLVASTPGPFLAFGGTGTNTVTTQKYLGRGVRMRAKQDRIFTKGLVAQGNIDMNGNNIKSDSFDSTDPNYNTNGRYDPNKIRDGGDIATNSGFTNSLNVGNADIMGKVSTGPGGSISIGPQGQVGSKAWFANSNKGVEPGWSKDDMNVTFPDVKNAPTGGVPPISGTNISGVAYKYYMPGGTYKLDSINMSGSDVMQISGNVVLYVSGNVNISGNAFIDIAPGASLTIFVAGSTTSIGGNGVVNETGSALNFTYWGLPSNTSIDVGGNGGFVGAIYAPEADLKLHGGGNSTTDFVGGAVTKTATLYGHFNFHYDEALKKLGPFKGYVASSWDEMTPDEVKRDPLAGTYTYTVQGGPAYY